MSAKEEFIQIYQENVHREGADALLDYLEHKSDFFTAPASARYHGSYAGGLCDHSVNVYHCLAAYLERERVRELRRPYRLSAVRFPPDSSSRRRTPQEQGRGQGRARGQERVLFRPYPPGPGHGEDLWPGPRS